ncbi:YqgE/AlgH family protein [Chlamydiifrater phoenicopteri]|uniref:YqgE/AlgH family protein n=1 Tax=Chlamydiifrater phoenicopteri TaxID=2681469 RepID=UPI001BCFE5C4|nr:YqgE/AlgH family protein [Chlamydiifrater phoenicopteri]
MSKKSYVPLKKGVFLIASPDIDKSVFSRSVILLCEHSVAGSFGLMLNRTLALDLSDEIFSLENVTNENARFCMGGPIQANQMMLLHTCGYMPDQTLEICPSVYLGGDVNFLQEMASNPSSPSLCLCFGYSGWQGGQLEKEFLEGQWFTSQASSQKIFNSNPETLWQDLLGEMGARYASLATVPENLLLN